MNFDTLKIELRQLIKKQQTFIEMCNYEKKKGNTHYWIKTIPDRLRAEDLIKECEEAIKTLP